MRIAMYEPDIPQNVGAMIRLCACIGLPLDIVEPCGFVWDERKMDRSAMDYRDNVSMRRYGSWDDFMQTRPAGRLVLMTTKAELPYYDFAFQDGDTLLAGRESSGVPEHIHQTADGRVTIPMAGSARSLNIVNAAAMIAGEAKRQTQWRVR